MNRNFLFITLCLLFSTSSFAGEIVLKGIYQGKNLFIMNPFSPNGGFCVTEVKINDHKINDDINSSAFEIDLSTHQLKLGDNLVVVIKHKEGCIPRVLNENVIKPSSTFEVKSLKFDIKTSTINMVTTKESGSLPYIVEQYRWNKWVKIGTIDGLGEYESNTYSVPVTMHSGVNKFRFRQRDFSNEDRLSREVVIRSPVRPVSYEPKKPTTSITFSAETDYEIFNSVGARVLHGKGTTIDISGLPKGDYFLNYDAFTERLKKR